MKMSINLIGLTPLDIETLESELKNLPGAKVKAVRTRDSSLVDSFLISLAANAIAALAAVVIRYLRAPPSDERIVTIEMRVPGQYLKFESTDPSLNEQIVKEQITNILMSDDSRGE